jgi:hypothetical protein
MSRIRSLFLAAPFVVSSFAACGGTVLGNQDGTKDSGAPDANEPHQEAGPRHDASARDAGHPDDAGGMKPDASSPGPTLLAPGKDFVLWGVTSDGFAIYSAASLGSSTLYAVSIAGGKAIEIDTLSSSSAEAFVAGTLVIVLDDITTNGLGTIETWSSKGSLHTISTMAYVYEFDFSPDFQYFAYFDNFDAGAQTGDAFVVKVDGTGPTLLQMGVGGVGYTSTCYAELAFVGSSPVLSYCTEGSTTSGNVYSFPQPSWSQTALATGVAPYFIPNPTGSNLLIYSASGMQVVSVSGGTPTTIDPDGSGAVFTSDGANVVYATNGGGLYRSSIASPSPVMLVASGIEGTMGLSPDDSTVLVYKSYDSTTYLTDLYSASAVTSGALTTLSEAETASVGGGQIVYGSPFSSDSSHVFFYTGVSTVSYPYLGTLQSSAVGKTTQVTLAQNSNTNYASGKTKTVFEDNFALLEGSTVATIDIKSFDTSTGASPSIVVSQANASAYYGSFFLSPDGTQVVYAQNSTKTSMAGVFVTPVP